MASISDEKLQELRDRTDVVAVVQRRVPLKKSGRDWKGLCPFHGEKTPSFYVVPDKHMWHCFGCGASGDAIKFVMQLESKSFREAAEQLAGEFGVDLAPPDPAEAQRLARRSLLAEVNDKAAGFYERVLWEHPKGQLARDHLRARGITDETAKAWRLGYAPSLWDSLCKSQALKGIEPSLVEEAGLGVPRRKDGRSAQRGGLYDRFRGRLMIPIRESGRVVGFGGRLMEGESDAKYLNSPDTPLYAKGTVLFGLERARQAIRDAKSALIVEGYFDVIGLHQGGIVNAVATCGTSLTEKHVELLRKSGAEELVFLFDGDAAGERAAQRASEIAAALRVPARVFMPPQGEDPDETILRARGSVGGYKHEAVDAIAGFKEKLAQAKPSLEFLLERALAKAGPSIEKRVSVVHAVKGMILAAPDELTREAYLEKTAQKLQLPLEAIRRALSGAPSPAPAAKAQARQAPASPIITRSELVITAALARHAELRGEFVQIGAAGDFVVGALRETAERICRDGDVDSALRVLEPDELRQRLFDHIEESRRADDQLDARGFKNLLQKHFRTVAVERKQRPSPRVATKPES